MPDGFWVSGASVTFRRSSGLHDMIWTSPDPDGKHGAAALSLRPFLRQVTTSPPYQLTWDKQSFLGGLNINYFPRYLPMLLQKV